MKKLGIKENYYEALSMFSDCVFYLPKECFTDNHFQRDLQSLKQIFVFSKYFSLRRFHQNVSISLKTRR